MALRDVLTARVSIAAAFTLALLAACKNDEMMLAHTPPPEPSQNTVDVPFCNGVQPNWVAFQDGDGAWMRALPVVEGQKIRFRQDFTSDHGAIAAARVFPGSNLTILSIVYGRRDELVSAADTTALHCGPAGTRTLLGNVVGISTNEIGFVAAGFGSGALVAPSDLDFSLQRLVPGPQDILAERFTLTGETKHLLRVILRRTADLPDSTLLSPFDFTSAEAF